MAKPTPIKIAPIVIRMTVKLLRYHICDVNSFGISIDVSNQTNGKNVNLGKFLNAVKSGIWSNLILTCNNKNNITVLEMDPRGPKNGRSKICLFLYSNGHTEAKKIPENFFPWYHLACFFKMKIF